MDTNRIRYFLSLAKTGSVTRAAELHHISAAAFSKAMKVFESEVGQALTLPQGRGLILTDYAQALVPKLESIISQIDAIQNTQEGSSTQERLRVATFEVFSTYFMSEAIARAFQEIPCELQELIPGRMEEAVANGKSDLAITYLPIPHPNLDFLKVTEIEMGIFGHASLLKQGDHRSLPFAVPVSPVEGSPNKVRGLDGWPDDAFQRNIKFHVEMLQTALILCSKGQAIAYLPKFIARLHNETVQAQFALREMALPRGFPKRKDAVYLIKRKSDEEGRDAKKMAQMIRKICAAKN